MKDDQRNTGVKDDQRTSAAIDAALSMSVTLLQYAQVMRQGLVTNDMLDRIERTLAAFHLRPPTPMEGTRAERVAIMKQLDRMVASEAAEMLMRSASSMLDDEDYDTLALVKVLRAWAVVKPGAKSTASAERGKYTALAAFLRERGHEGITAAKLKKERFRKPSTKKRSPA